MESNNGELEIDIMRLIQILLKRIWIIIIAAAIAGGAAFAWTYFMIKPLFESETLLYVNNSSFTLGSSSFSISSSELTAAQSLVDTYIVILKTRTTLEDVAKKAGVDYTYGELSGMITSSAVSGTEVFSVKVTSTDPYEAEKIANTIAVVLPQKIADIVDGSDVRIVDYAVVPAHRSSPSYTKNILIGIMLGAILSAGLIVLRELTDTIIKSDDVLLRNYDIPILSHIPDMYTRSKSKSYYNGYVYSSIKNDNEKDGGEHNDVE